MNDVLAAVPGAGDGAVPSRARRRTRLGLRERLMLFGVLLSLGGAISLGLSIERAARVQIEAEAGASLGELAYHMKERLDQGMFERWLDVQKLAAMRVMRETRTPMAERRRALEYLQQAYPDYAWIGLTDPACRVIVATQGLLEGVDVLKRQWCANARNGPFAGDVHEALLLQKLLQGEGGEPLRFVDVSTPVLDDDGRLVGVLGAHLSWTWAEEVRASFMQPLAGRHGIEIFIVDRAGKVLLGDDDSLGRALPLASVDRARGGKAGHVREVWPDGREYFTGYAPATGYRSYQGLGWMVLVRKPVAEALEPAARLARYTLAVGAGLSLLFIALGALIAARVAQPLSQIASAARRMREGDRDASIPLVDGYPEAAELSLSLHTLLGSLRAREHDLQRLNASLEAKVQARTADLENINISLLDEMAARRKAENERVRLIERLEVLATRDALTDLLNRRAFLEQLDQALEVRRRHGRALSLVIFDIDHFKRINDQHGHPAGDEVLRAVARELQLFLRSADSAGRIGGEEFALLLRETDAEQAAQQAERLRQRLENLRVEVGPQVLRITASFGVVSCPPAAAERDGLLKSVDIALYAAKHQGRNRVRQHLA